MPRRVAAIAAVILWVLAIAAAADLADARRAWGNLLIGAAAAATVVWRLERRGDDDQWRLRRLEAGLRSVREGLALAGVPTPPAPGEAQPPVRLAA